MSDMNDCGFCGSASVDMTGVCSNCGKMQPPWKITNVEELHKLRWMCHWLASPKDKYFINYMESYRQIHQMSIEDAMLSLASMAYSERGKCMIYFPTALKFEDISIQDQAKKIRSEVNEVIIEAVNPTLSLQRLADETFDTIHACETMLRKLEQQGVDIAESRARVEKKNKDRGYYEK